MKNVISFFAFILVMVFSSCSKEELLQPETASRPVVEYVGQSVKQAESNSDQDTGQSNLLTSVEVTVVSGTESNGELIVDLSGSYDFTDAILDATQYLVFVDGNSNESTLSFAVNSYNYSNGILEVNFEIAANNLGGLSLKELQHIIIDDQIIN